MEHNDRVRSIYNRLLKRHPEIIKVGDNPVILQIPIDKVIKTNANQVRGGAVEASGSSDSSGSDSDLGPKDIQANTQPDEPDRPDGPAEGGVVATEKSKDLSMKDAKSDTDLKQQNKSEHTNINESKDSGGSVKASDSSGSSDRESKSIPINCNHKKSKSKYFTTSTGKQ